MKLIVTTACSYHSIFQTIAYYLCGITVLSLGTFGSLIRRIIIGYPQESNLPYTPVSIVNTNVSPNYEIVWFLESVYRSLFATIVISTDSLLANILAHIVCQLLILQNSIRKLTHNARRDYLKVNSALENNRTLNTCI